MASEGVVQGEIACGKRIKFFGGGVGLALDKIQAWHLMKEDIRRLHLSREQKTVAERLACA